MMGNEVKVRIGAEDKTAKVFRRVRGSINSLAKVGALAGVAFGAAFVGAYAKAAKDIDQLAKKADVAGLGTKQLAALRLQAELAGVSITSLDSSMERFTKRMGEAEFGTGAAAKELKRLHLSSKEFFDLDPDAQYLLISEKIKGMETAQERAASAAQLFGREGVGMVAMLKDGAAGFKKAQEEAELFGTAIGRIDAAKIELANDEMTRLKAISSGTAQQLAVEFAPIVGALTNRMLEMTEAGGGIGKMSEKVVKFSVKAFGRLLNFVRGLKIAFMGVKQAVAEVANQILQLAVMPAKLGAGFAETLGFGSGALGDITMFAESFADVVSDGRQKLVEAMLEPMPGDNVDAFLDKFMADFNAKIQSRVDAGEIQTDKLKDANDAIIADQKSFNNSMAFLRDQDTISTLSFTDKSLGIIAAGSKKKSGLAKAAFAAQKTISMANMVVNTEDAATAALKAGGPYVGPILSGAIRGLGYASIGVVAGQAIASFEGGGMTGAGSRSGGVDGRGGKFAVLHPNEKVTDLDKGGAQAWTINIVNNAGGEATARVDDRKRIIDVLVEQAGNQSSKFRNTLHQTSNMQPVGGR